jgi:hypothetical protein
MNKKLHFLLFCLLLIFIVYLCKDKLLEPFGNQIVIHPDTAELNPRETTFSILTYDTNLGSGATQLSTCSDDSSWRMGEKTCRDYSLSGSNCEDIGSDGKSAFDACKVACDNCNTYTEVKRRLPSPVEEVDEPSYAQFEGSISDGDTGSDIGGPDYREIISRLDDMKDSMGTLDRTVGAGVSAIQGESENMRIQLSSLTEGSELRDQLTRLDVDNDGVVSLREILKNMRTSDNDDTTVADITSPTQMEPLINNIKSRLAQFTNTLIILCESLKKNNDLNDGEKLLTTVDVANIRGIIENLNTHEFNVVDRMITNPVQLFMDQGAFDAASPPPQYMPYNIAFLYLVNKYRELNITSNKPQFTSSVNEINTNELIHLLSDETRIDENARNDALVLFDYSFEFNQFTEKVNKLSKLLLVELNRIQSPTSNANTNNPPTTAPQLDVEQLKQNAIDEYIKNQEEEAAKDDDTKFEIGTGVGVAAAVLGGLYLFSQSK